MRTRTAIALRHLVVAAVLIALVVWLWRLGPNDVTSLPRSIDALTVWINRHDAMTLAFALVRLEALVLAAYLLTLTAGSAAARTLALPRATRLVDRVTLPVLRGLFGGAAALGVIAVPSPVHRSAQTVTSPTVVTPLVEDPDAQALLHLEVPDAERPDPPAPRAKVAAPVVAATETWVVEPGDSLWSIATSHFTDVYGTPAADADVIAMWRRLIDLNRDRLVDPDQPDLIFADQVFELPAVETG